MAGFLYYIRGTQNKPSFEVLEKHGLGGCVVDSFVPCMKFIDGTNGCIFTVHGRFNGDLKRIGFYNEYQSWTDFKIGENILSIGINLEEKITPKDLIKKDFIDGHKVALGDGNEWTIPLARRFMSTGSVCFLPKQLAMYQEGSIVEIPLEKYAKLQSIAEKFAILANFIDGEKPTNFIENQSLLFKVCADVLAVNYNLTYREITVLGLFDSSNMIEILNAIIDVPYVNEVLKHINDEEAKKKNTDMKNGS